MPVAFSRSPYDSDLNFSHEVDTYCPNARRQNEIIHTTESINHCPKPHAFMQGNLRDGNHKRRAKPSL